MTQSELAVGRALFPADELRHLPVLPAERSECIAGPRPCPFVSCRYHLFLDVLPQTGAIKRNFPDLELEELEETCALDVADRGGATLERVGELLNMTRENVRLIELKVRRRVRSDAVLAELLAHEIESWSLPASRTLPLNAREALEALETEP